MNRRQSAIRKKGTGIESATRLLVVIVLAVTYLKIPLQMRLDRQTVTGQAASYIEGFTVEKKFDLLDRGVINLLAEFGHSAQNSLGSMMEFP
jgi:hypothetical protein